MPQKGSFVAPPSIGNVYVALRGLLKIQATKIDTTYSTNIGAANSIILGMSFVGDRTAAEIRITMIAGRHMRTRKPAVTS
ncbi:MAG TPA: hypothetical protein VI750_07145, partial [Pyrinomonadaceae bacterium]|nr:hypothetical protein [Pyrinomonadaceae bacterium]